MAQQKTYIQRIGQLVTSVIPADILSDDAVDASDISSLRAEVRLEKLTFLQVTKDLHDGTYVAKVSNNPNTLASGYTVIPGEAELEYAYPYDCRARYMDEHGSLYGFLRERGDEMQPAYRDYDRDTRPACSLHGLPFGSIASELGSFNGAAMRLAVDASVSETENVQQVQATEPLLELPVEVETVQEVIIPLKKLKNMCHADDSVVCPWLHGISLQIALKALDGWIQKLWNNFQDGYADVLHHLREQRERIEAFLAADISSRRPVVRVNISQLTRRGLSRKARGASVIIDLGIRLPVAA